MIEEDRLMKKSRYTAEQIAFALSLPEDGHQRADVLQVEEEVRGHGRGGGEEAEGS